MRTELLTCRDIPAILWGEPSDRVFLFVHGKLSRKENARQFAEIAAEYGWQTLSFDLPEHGDRVGSAKRCDVFDGVADVRAMGDYCFSRWRTVALFGCSIGAFFSLHAFADRPFERCLFQSPVVDMESLIQKMYAWFGADDARLEREREIPTPVDPLRWDYRQYVRSHPVTRWDTPTAILYGGRDDLQDRSSIDAFCAAHGCALTVSDVSEHPFMAEGDDRIVENWIRRSLEK